MVYGEQRTANSEPRGWGRSRFAARRSPFAVRRPAASQLEFGMTQTDYIRHAARLARQASMDAAMGGPVVLDAEFLKSLAKALEQAADGLERALKRKD